jgi:hypothetical protein
LIGRHLRRDLFWVEFKNLIVGHAPKLAASLKFDFVSPSGHQRRSNRSMPSVRRPQDRFASLARLAATICMTRPAIERRATGANLNGPEPSAVVRTAAHAIDAGRRQAVDEERPIILCGLNRTIDPREGHAPPFEGRRIGTRFMHFRSAR